MNLHKPGKRQLVVAGVSATVIAAATAGTVLAVHSAPVAAPVAAAATASPTPSATPSAGKAPHHHAKSTQMVVNLKSATATSLTAVDSHGTSYTFALSTKVKVVGPDRVAKQLTSIPAGEILVVQVTHPTAKAPMGTSSTSPSPSPAQPTVVAIEDTGFAAR